MRLAGLLPLATIMVLTRLHYVQLFFFYLAVNKLMTDKTQNTLLNPILRKK